MEADAGRSLDLSLSALFSQVEPSPSPIQREPRCEKLEREGEYNSGFRTDYWNAHSDMILVREVAMMQVMETITDKPDWHINIFDHETAMQWEQEALDRSNNHYWRTCSNFHDRCWKTDDADGTSSVGVVEPPGILDQDVVKWCTAELRDKAKYFERTGIVPTLDSTFVVAKSDGFFRLEADRCSSGIGQFASAGLREIVDPSMYPLVFGHSRVVRDAAVGVADAIDKRAGTGEAIPGHSYAESPTSSREDRDTLYWSKTYQWLPSNMKFTDDGRLRFTSYINNLHPTKHSRMYESLEELVWLALPLWDQCVARQIFLPYHTTMHGAGRCERRIYPYSVGDVGEGNFIPDSMEEMIEEEITAGKITAPPDDPDEDSEFDEDEFRDAAYKRWCETRQFVQSECGAYSPVDFSIDPAKALQNDFREEGLQIIVKMTTVNLTPDKPSLEFNTDWKVEALLNEHIVGVAVYFLEYDNISPGQVDFRAMTSMHQDDKFSVPMPTDQACDWMKLGFGNYVTLETSGSCLQTYGAVTTRQGRLLAWPNYMHQRWSAFKLEDPQRNGCCRFLSLFLVDPLTRIGKWWAERAFGDGKGNLPPEIAQLVVDKGLGSERLIEALAKGKLGEGKLPVELLDLVRGQVEELLPMSEEDAREHWSKFMEERAKLEKMARARWEEVEYIF
ncbi:hypothetical protein QBC47DRAFT_454790 [Echria macrotheca]|uniref:Uncharacterized protein n=1 Tax=Echria macrotheca TaxID=438768 RepID=A0AAJ0F5N7_9PEZI|nr:hypothetical protein QBC47DRAFT_454790 [Echria macrotheca]